MQEGSRWYFFWLTLLFLSLFRHDIFCGHSESPVAPHKRDIRPQRGKKGGVEEQEERRERGTFVGQHLWLNSILYLSEIKINARQASSCMREEQSNHDETCFFLCECITATRSSAVQRSQWCNLRPNNLRPQLSKSIPFDTFRFALVTSWSDPVLLSPLQLSSSRTCLVSTVSRHNKQQNHHWSLQIKHFAGIIVNDALLHAILAVRAVQNHDPNKGALRTSWEHDNILRLD